MNIGSISSSALPLSMLGGSAGSPPSITATLSGASAMNMLASDANISEMDPKTKQAMADFESVFVSTLIKQMRQSVDGEGFFPGDKSDSLGGLFDLFMGQHLAEGGGLGLTQSLVKSYTKMGS